jgi:hypothetical protein
LDYYKIAASSGDESHNGGAKELKAKEIIHVETIYSDVKRTSIKTADVIRLATAVISKTATCAQYQLPPRVHRHDVHDVRSPARDNKHAEKRFDNGHGRPKTRHSYRPRILGIAKYAKAMLKLEKMISPNNFRR